MNPPVPSSTSRAGRLAPWLLLAAAPACAPPAAPRETTSRPTPPATVAAPLSDDALGRVVLTAEAEARLRIATAPATRTSLAGSRLYGGVAAAPPGREATLVAPCAGTVVGGLRAPAVGDDVRADVSFALSVRPYVSPERAWLGPSERLRFAEFARAARLAAVAAATDESAAAADVAATRLAEERARRAVEGEYGSARAAEEAASALRSATARRDAAASRRAAAEEEAARTVPETDASPEPVRIPFDGKIVSLTATAGSFVAAGAPLAVVVAPDPPWVRVAIPDGDVPDLDLAAPARRVDPARAADAGAPLDRAPEIPVGHAADGTTRVAYVVRRDDAAPPLGARVAVRVPMRARRDALTVPRSALLYDARGGASVFVAAGAGAYVRRSVEPAEVVGDRVAIRRGLADGENVVVAGAAELWGAAFGFGK